MCKTILKIQTSHSLKNSEYVEDIYNTRLHHDYQLFFHVFFNIFGILHTTSFTSMILIQ